jgi:hypothetical protein
MSRIPIARGIHYALLLLLLTQLIGCEQGHVLSWPGLSARTTTLFRADPEYRRIGWVHSPYKQCNTCTSHPRFSVRFSDELIIRPSQFTMAGLEAVGAEEPVPDENELHPRLPGSPTTKKFQIKTDSGYLMAYFDEKKALTAINIYGREGERRVEVGDRSGRRFVTIPASRDELIDVFGAPLHERHADHRFP